MSKTVVIRADASPQIGSGHIMRCLALADELKMRGAKVIFISREILPVLKEKIIQSGHMLSLLPPPSQPGRNKGFTYAHWLSEETEIDARQTLDVIRELGDVNWLVVDHYGIDARWERIIKENVERLMVIDEMIDRFHECDLLLDQTPGRKVQDYESLLTKKSKLFVGPEYALIRKEFRVFREKSLLRRESINYIGKILISFGGSKQGKQITESVLKYINNAFGDLKLYILGLAKKNIFNNYFFGFSHNIAELLVDADLSVGASGISALERCCLGVPQVLFCISENQEFIYEGLIKSGVAVGVKKVDEVVDAIRSIIYEDYKSLSLRVSSLTRGNGACIVSYYMLPYYNKYGDSVWLKPFEKSDLYKIYNLQIIPNIREYSINKNPPSLDEHKMWFYTYMNNPYNMGWLIYLNDFYVGVIRADKVGAETYEISIIINPKYQNRGCASISIKYVINLLRNKKIIAKVHKKNHASISVFKKNGFVIADEYNDDYFVMRYLINNANA